VTLILVCFGLVSVPDSVTVESLDLAVRAPAQPVQLSDPPQNAMMSGARPTPSGVPVAFDSRLARKMKSNDKRVFLVQPLSVNATKAPWNISFDMILNYVNTFDQTVGHFIISLASESRGHCPCSNSSLLSSSFFSASFCAWISISRWLCFQ
jgi:hypothetical protein